MIDRKCVWRFVRGPRRKPRVSSGRFSRCFHDPTGASVLDSVAGGAFGIAIARQTDNTTRLAAVNDDDNTIILLQLNVEGF